MDVKAARVIIATALGLIALTGCASLKTSDFASADPSASGAGAVVAVPGDPAVAETPAGLLGSDPNDDLSLGKKHFRSNNFGLAERHYRRAAETHPKDAEAWLGLAAAYDRLRRFDLADRAYRQVLQIVGPTSEVLNNQAYSYMLRGDQRRAREKLLAARAADPQNLHVNANLRLLQDSARKGKAIE
jgi:Flp pilus assembly protein TadD